jgi:hypothetical protein
MMALLLLAAPSCTTANPAYHPRAHSDGAPSLGDGPAADRPPRDAAADAVAVQDGATSTGTGLRGDYFDGVGLEAGDAGVMVGRRVDPTVDFDWGYGQPYPGVNVDRFSVRWTGQVMPLFSETYTFSTLTDDGVRLWVSGQLLIDRWVDQQSTTHSGTIVLTANQKYDIRLEYYEATEQAVARLSWSSRSQRQEIIPRACLFAP